MSFYTVLDELMSLYRCGFPAYCPMYGASSTGQIECGGTDIATKKRRYIDTFFTPGSYYRRKTLTGDVATEEKTPSLFLTTKKHTYSEKTPFQYFRLYTNGLQLMKNGKKKLCCKVRKCRSVAMEDMVT